MAERTGIEWTDATWNPLVGCSLKSPGCKHCFAMKWAGRLEKMGSPVYRGHTMHTPAGAVWNGKVEQSNLGIRTAPLYWRKPRRIFVNSMSDLFHEAAREEWIAEAFNIMAQCPQHTFQILTKRSARMRQIMDGPKRHDLWSPKLWHRSTLPNVWLGVSVEDQERADERIPDLQATPAAHRFLSVEPMLGGIVPGLANIDLVICGGESGKGARPMHPDWARALRDQCAAAGVPFFFKQWGDWIPTDQPGAGEHEGCERLYLDRDGKPCHGSRSNVVVHRIGKRRAGALLDGREHREMPA